MEPSEILEILKDCANFEIGKPKYGSFIYGFGSIYNCPICRGMSPEFYCSIHYPAMAKILESLPWTKIIENPRNPKPEDYPTEDGLYITMMDCNEHEICTNTFKDGNFSWMNKTHIKWWMPLSNLYETETAKEKKV